MPLTLSFRPSTAPRRLRQLLSQLLPPPPTSTASPPTLSPRPLPQQQQQQQQRQQRPFTMSSKTQEPVITSVEDLPITESKWVTLKRIHFTDQTGKQRTWESAERKTRSAKAGVDAVAMGNILLPPPPPQETTAGRRRRRPASTMLVIQYRPPLDSWTVEWPAGLIDAGEAAEAAARREFKEETGYEVTKVLSVSPPQAADPGMTNANMQLVMVEVQLPEPEPEPEGDGKGAGADDDDNNNMPAQRLDDGEHITRVVVPLAELYERLVEYSKRERFIVAAKLFHFAAGMEFMKGQKYF